MRQNESSPLRERYVREQLRFLSWVLVLCLLALLALSLTAVSQTQPIRVSGSVGLSTELYSSSSADPQWTPRSDQHVSRAVLRTTVTLFDQIDLPFEAYISTQSSGYHQPFNQFGVSPLIGGWLRLHGGYFSSRISDLTFGDERLLGGGVEMSPGAWRVSALYGRSRQALAPDTAGGYGGDYRRMITAAKVGYGKEGEFFVHLNALHAQDDTASISAGAAELLPAARENVMGSLAFGVPFGDVVRATGEVALSHTINDLRLRSREGYTAQVDGAAKLNILIIPAQQWQIGLNSRWVGPGYYTLGYVQMPNDIFEFTVAPALRLTEERINLRASLGMMFNNLRGNRLARTTRLIGSFTGNWQMSEQFGIAANYSNYGMRSTHTKDSLRVDHLTQSVYISPTYTFEGLGGTNSLNANFMLQSATDGNPVTTEGNENSARAAALMHSLTLPSTLNLTTGVTWNGMTSSYSDTDILSFSETVGRSFLDNALSVSLTGGYNIVASETGTDGQFSGRLMLGYSFEKYGMLSLSLSNNSYSYGQPDRPSFDEWYGSLQYSAGF
jgi:hypothetical protein